MITRLQAAASSHGRRLLPALAVLPRRAMSVAAVKQLVREQTQIMSTGLKGFARQSAHAFSPVQHLRLESVLPTVRDDRAASRARTDAVVGVPVSAFLVVVPGSVLALIAAFKWAPWLLPQVFALAKGQVHREGDAAAAFAPLPEWGMQAAHTLHSLEATLRARTSACIEGAPVVGAPLPRAVGAAQDELAAALADAAGAGADSSSGDSTGSSVLTPTGASFLQQYGLPREFGLARPLGTHQAALRRLFSVQAHHALSPHGDAAVSAAARDVTPGEIADAAADEAPAAPLPSLIDVLLRMRDADAVRAFDSLAAASQATAAAAAAAAAPTVSAAATLPAISGDGAASDSAWVGAALAASAGPPAIAIPFHRLRAAIKHHAPAAASAAHRARIGLAYACAKVEADDLHLTMEMRGQRGAHAFAALPPGAADAAAAAGAGGAAAGEASAIVARCRAELASAVAARFGGPVAEAALAPGAPVEVLHGVLHRWLAASEQVPASLALLHAHSAMQ